MCVCTICMSRDCMHLYMVYIIIYITVCFYLPLRDVQGLFNAEDFR